MEKDRIQFLQEAVNTNPNDRFARYALAMELAQSARPDAAWEHFQYLLEHHPEYSPTYYQYGVFLSKKGQMAEARAVFTQGIEVTGRQGNRHAQSELERALEELLTLM